MLCNAPLTSRCADMTLDSMFTGLAMAVENIEVARQRDKRRAPAALAGGGS